MTFTVSQLQAKHSGFVLKRFETPRGKSKMRIIQPTHKYICNSCDGRITDKAVRTEHGGNRTILTQCIPCAVEELNFLEKK